MKTIVLNENCKPEMMRHGDSGYDLKAAAEVYLPPGGQAVVPLGVCFDIPYGYYEIDRFSSGDYESVTYSNYDGSHWIIFTTTDNGCHWERSDYWSSY